MVDHRQKALESLLGSECVRITQGIYEWNGVTYQVIPHKEIKGGWSQFVKVKGRTLYAVRELTDKMKNKLCPSN
jgi:hypothetical protein